MQADVVGGERACRVGGSRPAPPGSSASPVPSGARSPPTPPDPLQLIGTAHGQLLENLIKNPTLSDLVGGICSVTLGAWRGSRRRVAWGMQTDAMMQGGGARQSRGAATSLPAHCSVPPSALARPPTSRPRSPPPVAGDDEARSRGTQKSVLERKAPPTFPLVIEMRDRAYWVMHWVEDSVDCLLTGKVPIVQVRGVAGGGGPGAGLGTEGGQEGRPRQQHPSRPARVLICLPAPPSKPASLPSHCLPPQVRRRDAASKKVVAEERRYDAEDRDAAGSPAPPASPAAGGVPRAATTGDAANNISGVFDSMFGYAPASFGNSYGAADTPDRPASSGARAAAAGAGADPYSWCVHACVMRRR